MPEPTTMVDRSRAPEPGDLAPYAFPPIERFELPNGIPVAYARIDGMPVVTISLLVRAGAAYEPQSQAGLSSLTASLLESGAGDRSAEEIATELEGLGAQLAVGATWDVAHLDLTSLTSKAEAGARIVADLSHSPHFPETEVDRLRNEHLAAILQRRADPRGLANEMAARFIFAPESPFSRAIGGNTDTLPGISREDVVGFHAAGFAPARAAIVVAGAVSREEAESLCSGWAGWTNRGAPAPAYSVAPRDRERRVYLIDRPGAVQSEIRVGHVGVERQNPDYFPIQVMNTILGGAFTSRLNLNLRERQGFTYGASSAFAMRAAPGPFLVSTAVQTEVTAAALREILSELNTIRDVPVTQAELVDSRNYLAGVFPLTLTTTSGVASRLAELVLFDLPSDYFDRYPAHILSVTSDDVQRVARQWLDPDHAAIVIAGDAERLRAEVETLDLGPIEVVDPAVIP